MALQMNRITCSTCSQLKRGCSWVARYLLQKCGETWERVGLEIMEEDFYEWYWEVMKPHSPYVVKEGDETKGKKHVLVKGKAKAQAKVPFDEEGEDKPEVGEGVEATVGENGGTGPSGLGKGKGPSVLAKGKGRAVGGKGDVQAVAGSQG